MLFLNAVLSAIPAVIVAAVIIYKNIKTEISSADIITFMLAGSFAVFPAAAAELLLSGYTRNIEGLWKLVVDAVLISALIEETAKILLLGAIFNIKKITTLKSAAAIAVASGTGFAFLENIMYSFDHSFVVIMRSLSAVPLHIITAVIIGLSLIKTSPQKRTSIISGFTHAIIIHGLYDFLLSTQSFYSFLIVPLLLRAGYSIYFNYKKESGGR
ncbi:MAG: PrsW family glutamic-type intramembrane protease [Spirochaetia bacterium]|nr:PrsW family glutamic-type intramembrane protease [Spirochaetia bacterium]